MDTNNRSGVTSANPNPRGPRYRPAPTEISWSEHSISNQSRRHEQWTNVRDTAVVTRTQQTHGWPIAGPNSTVHGRFERAIPRRSLRAPTDARPSTTYQNVSTFSDTAQRVIKLITHWRGEERTAQEAKLGTQTPPIMIQEDVYEPEIQCRK